MGHGLALEDGLGELLLHAPSPPLLLGDLKRAPGVVAGLRHPGGFPFEFESPPGAVHLDGVADPQTGNAADVVDGGGAALQLGDDRQALGHVGSGAGAGLGVHPLRGEYPAAGGHRLLVAGIAPHRLVEDPHAHDVQPGEVAALAPVQRRLRIVASGEGVDVYLQEIAEGLTGHHLQDSGLVLQPHGGGHDHGHPVAPLRGRVHAARFLQVHGHARLGENVLARLQGLQGNGTVHVGPGPHAHRVDPVAVDQLLPIIEDPPDAELVGHLLRRLPRAVAHRHHLDPVDLLKPGNVAAARIGAGPHDADSQCHEKLLPVAGVAFDARSFAFGYCTRPPYPCQPARPR